MLKSHLRTVQIFHTSDTITLVVGDQSPRTSIGSLGIVPTREDEGQEIRHDLIIRENLTHCLFRDIEGFKRVLLGYRSLQQIESVSKKHPSIFRDVILPYIILTLRLFVPRTN